MRKAGNDPERYVRRSDLSPGAPGKLGFSHRRGDAARAKRITDAMTSADPSYIDL